MNQPSRSRPVEDDSPASAAERGEPGPEDVLAPLPQDLVGRKVALRWHMLRRRRQRFSGPDGARTRVRAAAAWRDGLLALLEDTAAAEVPGEENRRPQGVFGGTGHAVGEEGPVPGGLTVAAYLPTDAEPPLTEALALLCRLGHRVIAPVSLPGRRLDWAPWSPGGPVRTTRFGVQEPVGPRWGEEAFAQADLRLVPALAIDARGVRLGYGGGFYDTALSLPSAARTVGVVFSDELLPAGAVPAEAHDARVREVLTERSLVVLPRTGS